MPVSRFPSAKKVSAPFSYRLFREEQVADPVAEKSKGYEVRTRFLQNGVPVSVLTEGMPASLEVKVICEQDAPYTQLEIPIPAGCSYADQLRFY